MNNVDLLIDGFIILLYFVGILTIGLYMGRKEDSLHDYALGGRKMPWWAVMASLIAAETSAATFIGTPAEGYNKQSFHYVQLVFGLIIARFLVSIYFLKPYYQYKVYTVYDFLNIRFGVRSKNFASILFLIMRTLASGTRIFAPTLVMVLAWQMIVGGKEIQKVEELTSWHPYAVAIIVLTVLTCFYAALGGIKAVIWTDVFQASLMFGGAILAIGMILYHVGGDNLNLMVGMRKVGEAVPALKTWRGYFATGLEKAPEALTLWDMIKAIFANEYTISAALIGSMVGNIGAFGTDQDMVQRLLTAETYKKSRRSMMSSAFMDLPIAIAFSFIGILLFVYYQQHPSQMPPDQKNVFSQYIMLIMPVGVRGLVLAGLFATAMGSLSAALNALATSFTNDWYIPILAPGRSEKHYVGAARLFTASFALIMIVIACVTAYVSIANKELRIIPVVLGVGSMFLGPMLGVFLLGMFTKSRGSDGGNVLAIICSLSAMLFVTKTDEKIVNAMLPKGAEPYHNLLPPIAFTWWGMIGALIVVVIGVFFRTPQHVVDSAKRRMEQAKSADDRPLAMRNAA